MPNRSNPKEDLKHFYDQLSLLRDLLAVEEDPKIRDDTKSRIEEVEASIREKERKIGSQPDFWNRKAARRHLVNESEEKVQEVSSDYQSSSQEARTRKQLAEAAAAQSQAQTARLAGRIISNPSAHYQHESYVTVTPIHHRNLEIGNNPHNPSYMYTPARQPSPPLALAPLPPPPRQNRGQVAQEADVHDVSNLGPEGTRRGSLGAMSAFNRHSRQSGSSRMSFEEYPSSYSGSHSDSMQGANSQHIERSHSSSEGTHAHLMSGEGSGHSSRVLPMHSSRSSGAYSGAGLQTPESVQATYSRDARTQSSIQGYQTSQSFTPRSDWASSGGFSRVSGSSSNYSDYPSDASRSTTGEIVASYGRAWSPASNPATFDHSRVRGSPGSSQGSMAPSFMGLNDPHRPLVPSGYSSTSTGQSGEKHRSIDSRSASDRLSSVSLGSGGTPLNYGRNYGVNPAEHSLLLREPSSSRDHRKDKQREQKHKEHYRD